MTTNVEFITAVQGMTVAGVTTHYDEPPLALNTADLPAAFPLLPTGSRVEPVSTCIVDAKTRAIQYAIAIEPVAQSTLPANYAQLGDLMDALETAIDALDTGLVFVEYSIEAVNTPVAGVDYWALLATINGRNA